MHTHTYTHTHTDTHTHTYTILITHIISELNIFTTCTHTYTHEPRQSDEEVVFRWLPLSTSQRTSFKSASTITVLKTQSLDRKTINKDTVKLYTTIIKNCSKWCKELRVGASILEVRPGDHNASSQCRVYLQCKANSWI